MLAKKVAMLFDKGTLHLPEWSASSGYEYDCD